MSVTPMSPDVTLKYVILHFSFTSFDNYGPDSPVICIVHLDFNLNYC